MKVHELITKLVNCNQDASIEVDFYGNTSDDIEISEHEEFGEPWVTLEAR